MSAKDRVCAALDVAPPAATSSSRSETTSASVDLPKQLGVATEQWRALRRAGPGGEPLRLKACNSHEVTARQARSTAQTSRRAPRLAGGGGQPAGRLPKAVWDNPGSAKDAFGDLKPESAETAKAFPDPDGRRTGGLRQGGLPGSKGLAYRRDLEFDSKSAPTSVVDTQHRPTVTGTAVVGC